MPKAKRPVLAFICLLGLSGLIRLALIHHFGITPPFRDKPSDASWAFRFDTIYDKPYTRYAGLLSGLIGAYLMCHSREKVARFFSGGWLPDLLALACLALCVYIAYTPLGSAWFQKIPPFRAQLWYSYYCDAFSVCAMLLIFAALNRGGLIGRGLQRFLSWKALYPVAQLSYSIYLTHEMLMLWLFPKSTALLKGVLSPFAVIALDGVMVVVLTVVLTTALYVWVERPCMELRALPWFQRLGSTRRTALGAPVSAALHDQASSDIPT